MQLAVGDGTTLRLHTKHQPIAYKPCQQLFLYAYSRRSWFHVSPDGSAVGCNGRFQGRDANPGTTLIGYMRHQSDRLFSVLSSLAHYHLHHHHHPSSISSRPASHVLYARETVLPQTIQLRSFIFRLLPHCARPLHFFFPVSVFPCLAPPVFVYPHSLLLIPLIPLVIRKLPDLTLDTRQLPS